MGFGAIVVSAALLVGCVPLRQNAITTTSVEAVEPAGNENATKTSKSKPGWQHFVEPDALAFVWGSGALAVATFAATEPSHSAFWFPTGEGGAEPKGNTIPNWQVALGSALAPALVASFDREARWHHTKGITQALLTTAALTELSKNAFQRHRPSYDATSTDPDARKSFFSGHSSLTLAATTYVGMYLHEHVFARWRGDASLAWWEIPSYASLAALSVWVPYTRIKDNMHHTSDVFVGGFVGASLSALFFTWQERRYRRDRQASELSIVPMLDTPGASVVTTFD